MQFDCPVKRLLGSVPAAKWAFQSIAAVCYRLICEPAAPSAPAALHTINIANAIDITNANETYVKSLIDTGTFITEVREEEKESRLSN